MNFTVKFAESNQSFAPVFEEILNVSDGGYELGYADGLAARTYETWTITLTDGSVVEKEVALL